MPDSKMHALCRRPQLCRWMGIWNSQRRCPLPFSLLTGGLWSRPAQPGPWVMEAYLLGRNLDTLLVASKWFCQNAAHWAGAEGERKRGGA